MKSTVSFRWAIVLAILGIYLCTGFYAVPADEVAVVRSFGKVVLPPVTSGLHYSEPWPFSRRDRVNLNSIRTLSIGDVQSDPNPFLKPAASSPSPFLTGDKNLLLLRIVVQYRVSEERIADWLYSCERPEKRLQLVVETTAADLVSRSGVDFVHTQGLADLNNRLLQDVRQVINRQRIGCEVERVTIDRAEPPTRVKAEFLDVSNARADMSRSINEARSYYEQKITESHADAQQVKDSANQARHTKSSISRGTADRFVALVDQLRQDSKSSTRDYNVSRQITMNRLFLETLRDILKVVKSKVILDGPQPADLIVPRDK